MNEVNDSHHSEPIKATLKTLPDDPGVYKFIDAKGTILYIGKAKNLKKRVSSYFLAGRGHSYRIQTLVRKAEDIQYTVTNSEAEALLLENNLIKQVQPRYNINLKDGKTYPYICVKNEPFPRIFPTRKKISDGSRYYGPFANVKGMNAILDLIRLNFKVRTCNLNLTPENIQAKKFRVCLEYQIGNCGGPCEGLVAESEYDANIEQIEKILKGNFEPLMRQLKEEMEERAENYEYEKAEVIRQKIERISSYRRNSIFSETVRDAEVLAIDTLNDLTIVNHLKMVNGTIIQTHSWEFRRKEQEEDDEIMRAVLSHLIFNYDDFGKEVYTNLEFDTEEFGERVKITCPQRGDKKRLVDLSLKNCKVLLEEKVIKQNFRKTNTTYQSTLERLQQDLHLKELPNHIECFDNSNLQGTFPVASLVVFKQGKPAKNDYRHFKIKTVEGPNDFASMKEIVTRRYKRLLDEESPLPNLVIVDGGKGQLSSAAEALEELGITTRLPIIGIAKRLEEIYVPNDSFPLYLDKRSTSLKLIQQLRNEAHRFAITFHRNLRSKAGISTMLTNIKGIGDKTAKELLREFRSIKKIEEEGEEKVGAIIGASKARILFEALEKGEI
ncbi:MAG: excinuclease ABC subunit C [Bacteroidia bacterium]|nr:excinuclease ABC subunit C [Bacteroidia bacterium]